MQMPPLLCAKFAQSLLISSTRQSASGKKTAGRVETQTSNKTVEPICTALPTWRLTGSHVVSISLGE